MALGSSLPARLVESPGSIFYASTTGNDTTGDGSFGNPWATLSKLASTLTAGQTGRLRGGTYGSGLTAGVTWSAVGTNVNPITIENHPGENVVVEQRLRINGQYLRLRGNSPVGTFQRGLAFDLNNFGGVGDSNLWVSGNGANVELFGVESKNAHFQGCLVGPGGSGGTACDNIQIINCYFHDNGTRTSPADHNLYYGTETVTNGAIYNNIFSRAWVRNTQFYDEADGTIYSNNVAAFAGQAGSVVGSGLHVAGGTDPRHSDNTIVKNSIFYDNLSYGFRTQWDATQGSGNICDRCIGFSNASGDLISTFGGVTITNGNTNDPLFVNAAADNFALQAGSPAIGLGDEAYCPTFDFLGQTRTQADAGPIAFISGQFIHAPMQGGGF